MDIKYVDLTAEYHQINEEVDKAISETLESGKFILGEQNLAFENEFSEYIGTKYGIGLNSGTDGLYLALKALGIGRGDEVITVSNTYVSTVDAIVRNGAKPVFVDIDLDTYNMNADLLKRSITNKTRAIIPVHLYGQSARLDVIMEIAEENGLFVVEDACQAHGATFKGKKVGSFGDMGVFSFYPTKNLGAYGDGGMVVTDKSELLDKLTMLRNNGQREKYRHDLLGVNSRLDEIQASILRVKLKHLDNWNQKRRQIASRYKKALADSGVKLPDEIFDRQHVFHLFVIRHEKRDALLFELKRNGIPALVHYPVPVHRQPYYTQMYGEMQLTNTNTAAREILSIPIHPFLGDSQIEYISQLIAGFLKR